MKQIAAAVQKLQKDGAQKLVLDVRNCATGTPEDGIALANLFLNKGRITYLQGQRCRARISTRIPPRRSPPCPWPC